MAFRILEDVALADVALEIRASTLEELFSESARAVQSVQFDLETIEGSIVKELKLANYSDLKELLYSFLCEVIFYKDAESLAIRDFQVEIQEVNGSFNLVAKLYGERIDPAKHTLLADIKAITRHLFELKKEDTEWKAVVVVDV